MLKMTASKVIAEASNDKLWGTGIRLRDKDILMPKNGKIQDSFQIF